MPTAADDDVPAWTWSWLRWRKGSGSVLFWIVLIHALALVGAVLFPLPGWTTFLCAWGLFALGGLGTTVAYHRGLAHGALRLHPAVERVLVGCAIFNGSGAPASWTANHRLHHAKVETVGDISSPQLGGFWWSHLRWLWQAEESSIPRWAPDLNKPAYAFWTRWQPAILLLSLCIGLPFGWATFFWLGAMRLVFSLHAQCTVNSLAHMRKGAVAGEDSSRNIPWLAVLHTLQGENWHRNHHAQPNSARLGWNWKQADLGWWVIWSLERAGLARNVRRPRLST
jgi:sn-1 stearoyl-lipid 9-desaturase